MRSTSVGHVTAKCCAELRSPGPLRGPSASMRSLPCPRRAESLRQHGHHGARAGEDSARCASPSDTSSMPLPATWSSHTARTWRCSFATSTGSRDESESGLKELELLRPARFDAQALVEITKSREIGADVRDRRRPPSGCRSGGLRAGRCASGGSRSSPARSPPRSASRISWFVLRGAALASRRIASH